MDTLWLNWTLDQLPEDRPSREIVSHGMERVSSSMAPLSPSVWTELCQASFSSWNWVRFSQRCSMHNSTVPCLVPVLFHMWTTFPFLSIICLCVCVFSVYSGDWIPMHWTVTVSCCGWLTCWSSMLSLAMLRPLPPATTPAACRADRWQRWLPRSSIAVQRDKPEFPLSN